MVSGAKTWLDAAAYFLVTILGFSFLFFLGLPFASHRETYWWLAMVHTEPVSYSLSFISSTYRPLHQVATWLGYIVLDHGGFPTSPLRQTLIQLVIYGCFVAAWWLIYLSAPRRRVFAVLACIVGGVFFSGYVQLFHVHGNAYVPPMLLLGALLWAGSKGLLDRYAGMFAAIATCLVLWHPFTPALFVGVYGGYYLQTWRSRRFAELLRGGIYIAAGIAAIGLVLVVLPRMWPGAAGLVVQTAKRPLGERLFAFVASYQTNEVNRVASVVAFALSMVTVAGARVSPRWKIVAAAAVTLLAALCLRNGIPLVLVWVGASAFKLLTLRQWRLMGLLGTVSLFPFGGGIGSPIHSLFALIVCTYVAQLELDGAEEMLSRVKVPLVAAAVIAAAVLVVAIRAGINVPIVGSAARPLLVERERTYQLENVLAWLRQSRYCGYTLSFVDAAGNPADSMESAINRTSRPPAALGDVREWWSRVGSCNHNATAARDGTVTVIFDDHALRGAEGVYTVPGRYARDATVWVQRGPD